MTADGWIQIVLYMAVLLLLVKPVGSYMANVYMGRRTPLRWALQPLERAAYRLAGISANQEMSWRNYALALLAFNAIGFLAVYGLQRLQGFLPLNPAGFSGVQPGLAFNTAVSFTSNTNWQAYGGETTLSHLTQMAALTVQNFVSAATGMAVLVALVRGLSRRSATTIGSFWVDLTRGVIYILLPFSFILALLLVSQGVVQTFAGSQSVPFLDHVASTEGSPVLQQILSLGPAASQIAIKQLGTNGGGFFNVNSAHPFENPNAISGFLEMLAILLIPAALCYTFGKMVGDTRKGWAILAVMTAIFLVMLSGTYWAESQGNPNLAALGVDAAATNLQPGGNMEGKELRFGIADSAIWATATTAASNGSVDSMHDSYTPLGGLMPMWLIQFGEVVFGGVGSGLYGMLAFVIVAVFVAGLMVGRTPEYLGKKVEAFEMKMATIVVLMSAVLVLVGTAVAISGPWGRVSMSNGGPHGLSEVMYAFSSAGNNNGSAFAGLNANTLFYNTALGLAMLFGRYWIIIPMLAIAGSMARKKAIPEGAGTLRTHTPLFVGWLIAIVVLVGALSFFPALALGPIVEHLMLAG